MNKVQTFQDFLVTQSVQIPLWSFAFNLLLAGVLAFILSRIYIKFGYSISNRKYFAKNFVIMAMTTMMIISIVKSSLALSLGLVGALSIVRFRAAIKEPEELSYLFLTIAIGLGLGADQTVITVIAFSVICLVIWVRNSTTKEKEINQNLYLTVASEGSAKIQLSTIVKILQKTCPSVNLKRFDENENVIDATFFVEFKDFNSLEEATKELRNQDKSVKITFLDNKGIIS